jgi:hypothetical protein
MQSIIMGMLLDLQTAAARRLFPSAHDVMPDPP